MSGSLFVDPEVLLGLSEQAAGLAEEVGQLGAAGEVGGGGDVGDANLAAAIEAFGAAWRERTAEMQAELGDAADFLATFADMALQLDADIAATTD